ncbi:MAG TPA: hypothetical protein VGL02_18415 [Streptomyces sp.]
MTKEEVFLAALPPFTRSLTDGFVEQRRATVSITELQDRVVTLVAFPERGPDEIRTRHAVRFLIRYLARSQERYFFIESDQLHHRVPEPADDGETRRVIVEFSHDVDRRIRGGYEERRAQEHRTSRPEHRERGEGRDGRERGDGRDRGDGRERGEGRGRSDTRGHGWAGRRRPAEAGRPPEPPAAHALDDFFADFEQEIRGARLGREGDTPGDE